MRLPIIAVSPSDFRTIRGVVEKRSTNLQMPLGRDQWRSEAILGRSGLEISCYYKMSQQNIPHRSIVLSSSLLVHLPSLSSSPSPLFFSSYSTFPPSLSPPSLSPLYMHTQLITRLPHPLPHHVLGIHGLIGEAGDVKRDTRFLWER